MDAGTEVTTEDELRTLLGAPNPRAAAKDRAELDDLDVQWIARSPLCLVATSDADGRCDVSPKGDPGGFVAVLDTTTLAIPERPGNRRADGFANVLTNPHVGLLFVVPGRGDTLRVNGRARIVRDTPGLDHPVFDGLVVGGHRPVVALVVDVEQVFFHCAKAFLRSRLWDPTSWEPDAVASRPVIAQRLERPEDSLDDLERYYGPAYAEKLYG